MDIHAIPFHNDIGYQKGNFVLAMRVLIRHFVTSALRKDATVDENQSIDIDINRRKSIISGTIDY